MGGGVVGPGRPTVGAMTTSMTTSSASTLVDQPRDAAGIDPVREPMKDSGSPSDDTVTERHRAVAAPAVGAAATNPTHVKLTTATGTTTIFSERELKFTFAICHRPSVCRLSVVCNVRAPYSED